MIEVSGYLDDLVRDIGGSIDIDWDSLENTPITNNGKCVGVVTKVDLIKRIWYGYLWEPLVSFNYNEDNKKYYFASLNFFN